MRIRRGNFLVTAIDKAPRIEDSNGFQNFLNGFQKSIQKKFKRKLKTHLHKERTRATRMTRTTPQQMKRITTERTVNLASTCILNTKRKLL